MAGQWAHTKVITIGSNTGYIMSLNGFLPLPYMIRLWTTTLQKTELLCFSTTWKFRHTRLLHLMDGSSKDDEIRIMEGWLYRIRSNKFGFQYSRKRYYVLQNHLLKSFTSVPISIHNVRIPFSLSHSKFSCFQNGFKARRNWNRLFLVEESKTMIIQGISDYFYAWLYESLL